MSSSYTKQVGFSTLVLFVLLFISPIPVNSMESSLSERENSGFFQRILTRSGRNFKNHAKNLTPEQMEEIIAASKTKTYSGNPGFREGTSSILRPIKQIALRVIDGEIGILKTFLAYQSAVVIRGAATQALSRISLDKARQVIALMNTSQIQAMHKALSELGITTALLSAGPGLRSFIEKESNFAMVALIGALISMGIYDGLDLQTTKDRVLSLDPLSLNSTLKNSILPGLAAGMGSRNLIRFFNGRFDLFYEKMLASKSFGSEVLRKFEKLVDAGGQRISAAGRKGITQKSGQSLTKKLGLVGVGQGTALTLQGLLRSAAIGIAYGMAGQLVVDSLFVGTRGYSDSTIIGGNRDHHSFLPEYNNFLYQKTGKNLQDWLNERRFALQDYWDGFGKTPLTKVVSKASGFTGAYLGSVAAGAVLVGGGLPVVVGGVMISALFGGMGEFMGHWVTRKFDRGEKVLEFRRTMVEDQLFKALKKMEITRRLAWDDEKLRELAKLRSSDIAKREYFGQSFSRLFLVESFSQVELYRSGDYVKMRLKEEYGEKFDVQAHIRYELVDIDGNQGQWDLLTNKVYNVGNIQENNGRKVTFLSDDKNISIQGNILESREGTNFRVLSNGLLMARSDYDANQWVIRGQNIDTDVFLRVRRERFSWDEGLKAYHRTIAKEEDPLAELRRVFESENPEQIREELYNRIRQMISESRENALETLEKVSKGSEVQYLKNLQEQGVSKEVVENFLRMDHLDWKSMFKGNIHRRTGRISNNLFQILQEQSLESLKVTLEKELENPKVQTEWDHLRGLMEPEFLAAGEPKRPYKS